jgi:hypothetical protein
MIGVKKTIEKLDGLHPASLVKTHGEIKPTAVPSITTEA